MEMIARNRCNSVGPPADSRSDVVVLNPAEVRDLADASPYREHHYVPDVGRPQVLLTGVPTPSGAKVTPEWLSDRTAVGFGHVRPAVAASAQAS